MSVDAANNDLVKQPELTLPETEAKCLRAAYEQAQVILEYGSGGSTVMAAEMPGKKVVSVESDQGWAEMMRGWFAQSPPAEGSTVEVVWADIGPTTEWGFPQDDSNWAKYAHYPLKVWDMPGFVQPDVVLVDGRFRSGCALATAFRTKKPVRVFIDDYKRREQYHKLKRFIGSPRLHGRMAEFEVQPTPVPAEKLLRIIKMMTHP